MNDLPKPRSTQAEKDASLRRLAIGYCATMGSLLLVLIGGGLHHLGAF